MKRYQVLLFIFGVVAGLTVLCAFFPEDGLKVGGTSFNFPSVMEILEGGKKDEGPSPEEVIEMRRQAAAAAQKDEYLKFFNEDPARFYLPDGDLSFFDSLFKSLDNAKTTPVRIVHYGDSQIEEDRITGPIRSGLQKKFGGSGQGMMPVRSHYTQMMGASVTSERTRYMVFANRAGTSKYGPYGDFVRLDTAITVTYRRTGSKDKTSNCSFNRATLVAGNIHGKLNVVRKGDKRVVEPGNDIEYISFELPDSSVSVSLSLYGSADLYGVLLDTDKGVQMDNVPMRGCSGAIFTQMNSAQLRSFYKRENVRMIMLEYGGNSVPYLKTDDSISKYVESIKKQILHLKSLAPDAVIVFIGPSDMSTSVKGKMQTYPKLSSIIDSLRTAANECGAAYWDIYGVMGGENSMVNWVKARPSLAGTDYVHFTPRGSQKVGEMFCDSFMLYYDYYKWRMKNGK